MKIMKHKREKDNMKTTLFKSVLFFSAVCMLLSACNLKKTETPDMANPAAVFCKDQGYDYEIRTDESGNQYGVCIFPDGSECDEWAYYEGECAPGSAETGEAVEMANPAASFCVDQGYDYEIRTDENDGQYGVCIFPDRSECEGWAFYNGECAPGDFTPDETNAAEPKEPEASNPAEMTYEDEEYGLKAAYPEGWTLEASSVGEATNDHPASRLLEFSKDNWVLIVHYKSPEDVTMIGGGMGAGEIIQDTEIMLLGQSVPVNRLVYEGKTKMIYVVESLNDLEIYASLSDPSNQDYALLDVPEEIWLEAAKILETLTFTTP